MKVSDEALRRVVEGERHLCDCAEDRDIARDLLAARRVVEAAREHFTSGGAKHARLFIGMRQRMHPDGITLHEVEMGAILVALSAHDKAPGDE